MLRTRMSLLSPAVDALEPGLGASRSRCRTRTMTRIGGLGAQDSQESGLNGALRRVQKGA